RMQEAPKRQRSPKQPGPSAIAEGTRQNKNRKLAVASIRANAQIKHRVVFSLAVVSIRTASYSTTGKIDTSFALLSHRLSLISLYKLC
ncbi:MAG: hypothetical protein N3F09_10235, partial [Bacteroidia bacterium]|nr:hypothetical protein [Bacteroidia bacterium]